MDFISNSIEETEKIAKKFLSLLSSKSEVTVIGLKGDLGSGKTAFTKCLAKILGIKEEITSPTFVIRKSYGISKSYKIKAKSWKQLIHIDAYRLKNGEELLNLEFKKDLEKKENLIIIEWSEIVSEILPPHTLYVQCEFIDEYTRKFTF